MAKKRNQSFDDGVAARRDFRESGRKISARKMDQLCAQIRRALELALLGTVQDEALMDLEVESVQPSADPGRLLVVFLDHGDPEVGLEEVQRRVEAARGIFTAEVAQAIHRKQVPDLVFEVRRT